MGLYSREDYENDLKLAADLRVKATRKLLGGQIDSWRKMAIDRKADEFEAAAKRQLASTRLILADVEYTRFLNRECKNKGHKQGNCRKEACPCKCHKG